MDHLFGLSCYGTSSLGLFCVLHHPFFVIPGLTTPAITSFPSPVAPPLPSAVLMCLRSPVVLSSFACGIEDFLCLPPFVSRYLCGFLVEVFVAFPVNKDPWFFACYTASASLILGPSLDNHLSERHFNMLGTVSRQISKSLHGLGLTGFKVSVCELIFQSSPPSGQC